MTPRRIQRSRAKGWRMPANTVYVGRPTKWGNPFLVSLFGHDVARALYRLALDPRATFDPTVVMVPKWRWAPWAFEAARRVFLDWAGERDGRWNPATLRAELRGQHLACWCRLGQPCHADVLLELANQEPT